MSLTLLFFIQQVHSYIDTIELFPWVKRGFSFQYQTLHVVWYTFSNQPIHPQIVRRQSCFPLNNRRTALTNKFLFPAISSKKRPWPTFWIACINVWLDEGFSPNRGHEERPRAIYYVPEAAKEEVQSCGISLLNYNLLIDGDSCRLSRMIILLFICSYFQLVLPLPNS